MAPNKVVVVSGDTVSISAVAIEDYWGSATWD
ncbi:hypothetical protein ABIB49_003641 [Arthrobacter sp. UYCu512]